MPESVRAMMMRRQLNANFEASDFIIQFYADDKPVIDTVGAEVRGDGNPNAALAALCRPNGWIIVDNATDSAVDLVAENSPEWEKFKAWRDKSIASMKSVDSSARG